MPTLYYFDACKTEFDVINHVLNWQNIPVKHCESHETLKFTRGKSMPVLVDADQNVLGVGFYGIVKYLDRREC